MSSLSRTAPRHDAAVILRLLLPRAPPPALPPPPPRRAPHPHSTDTRAGAHGCTHRTAHTRPPGSGGIGIWARLPCGWPAFPFPCVECNARSSERAPRTSRTRAHTQTHYRPTGPTRLFFLRDRQPEVSTVSAIVLCLLSGERRIRTLLHIRQGGNFRKLWNRKEVMEGPCQMSR